MTNVTVPKEKLRELDEARIRLHDILEKTGLNTNAEVFAAFMEVTGVMWKIANRAWPEERLPVPKEKYESSNCV